jgi:hypothetical protein
LELERQLVFGNEEHFSHVGKKILLGMSFNTPPLFDHYGDSDEDVEVCFEEKGIRIHPLYESESF